MRVVANVIVLLKFGKIMIILGQTFTQAHLHSSPGRGIAENAFMIS